MTVNELLQLLKGYPPDLRVVVNGYEEGYDDLSPEQTVRDQSCPEHGENAGGKGDMGIQRSELTAS